AANYRHGMTESFDETRFIRSIVLVLARAFERFLQKVGTENLRGLREYEMLSRQCRFDEILFRLFHRIDDRDRQNRCAGTPGLPYDILDFRDRDKGPNGIVNCDECRSGPQMPQATGDGILAAFAAFHD